MSVPGASKSDSRLVLGIDGCPGGWLVASCQAGSFSMELVRETEQLREKLETSAFTFIDMPMGLLDEQSPRPCDRLLRNELGSGYAGSVFNVPVRSAVYANTYRQACTINEQAAGKKISRQVWNILPRIKRLDLLMRENRSLIPKVKECHPEFLFQLINNGNTPAYKKKTKEGYSIRSTLLGKYNIPVDRLEKVMEQRYLKKEVKPDDLLDALVLGLAAKLAVDGKHTLYSLPENPETDAGGIPAAIYFIKP